MKTKIGAKNVYICICIVDNTSPCIRATLPNRIIHQLREDKQSVVYVVLIMSHTFPKVTLHNQTITKNNKKKHPISIPYAVHDVKGVHSYIDYVSA